MAEPEEQELEAPWRWTLKEYLLRCEQGRNLREVVVEGALDRDVVGDALSRWGHGEVGVVCSDRLMISNEDVSAAGYDTGVKGQLLTLAAALRALAERADIKAIVTVIVDRDYDAPPAPSRWLSVTDGHSMESYMLLDGVLDRFVRIALGRSYSLIPGRGRRLTNGADLLSRILDAASEVAAVRIALRTLLPPVGLIERWLDYVRIEPDGRAETRGRDLLQRSLAVAARTHEQTMLETLLPSEAVRMRSEPFLLLPGRDLTAILAKLMRSSWGRRLAGVYGRAEPSQLARAILATVDPSELDEQPMFAMLRNGVAASEDSQS